MLARQATTNGMLDLLKTAAPSRSDAVRRMEFMAKLLDNAFVIPGPDSAWALTQSSGSFRGWVTSLRPCFRAT